MPAPDLTPREIEALKADLANGIHEAETIAKRYGLITKVALNDYLIANPWIVGDVMRMKSLIDSDEGTPGRIEIKSQVTYEDIAIPALAGIVADDTKPAKDRIDAAKLLKESGKIGTNKNDQAQTGTSFNLTINLPGGRTENITTVVDTAPALPPADEVE